MTAKLIASTRKVGYQTVLATEDLKGKYRKEFEKRNDMYPYHLRIIFKDKTVVRHFEVEKEARFAYEQNPDCTAILIKFNNLTGPRHLGYRYVL